MGLIEYMKPHEKQAIRQLLQALLMKFDEIEKEFPFEKEVYVSFTVNALRIRVKPKKFLPKDVFKKYARKYGWGLYGFKLDDENVKAPKDYLGVWAKMVLEKAGAKDHVTREHVEKALELLE